MSWFRNTPISRKFTFAFGVVCALCILLGAYIFITFRGIAERSADVSGTSFPALVHLSDDTYCHDPGPARGPEHSVMPDASLLGRPHRETPEAAWPVQGCCRSLRASDPNGAGTYILSRVFGVVLKVSGRQQPSVGNGRHRQDRRCDRPSAIRMLRLLL